jgi:hypothetical protein
VKLVLAGCVAATILLATSVALAAHGYTDTADDANTAPDITSLDIAETTPGVLTIHLSIGNYQALPANSWVNLWFDVDSNPRTGDVGDEALVRYGADGILELFAWNGSRLVEGSTTGATGSFAAGVLSVSVPRASIGAVGAFEILAVASRGQVQGTDQLIASDYVPNEGRSSFTGPEPAVFSDPANDHDAAPDITSVRVSDAKSGWVTFAISTPNYQTLPAESVVLVWVDVDDNGRTGLGGADLQLTILGTEITLERWDPHANAWVLEDPPTRARVRNSGNVVSVDVHVSELDNTRRFRFSLASADVNTATQQIQGADFAPDGFAFWRYALANKPAVKLVVTRVFASAIRPTAGRTFTVGLGVTRSDTGRPVTSGTVGCRVLSHGHTVPAAGRISGGAGRCTFVVPKGAVGSVIRGTITVHSGGKAVSDDFAFVVR